MQERITEEELRRIYGETINALYGFASRRCGGRRELAEDVTQEAWLRAVRDWRQNGAPRNPLGWLTTVARNLISNHARRRESVSLDLVSPAEVFAAVESNNVADSAEIASLVSDALTRLPEAEARLLETFHYDRLKMSQLAEVYGISERAVEGRLRRARERLRREIEITLKAERGLA
ncbi:MAG TPA: sigma-70 family RNA polymerase sigma factor [Gemmatimonadaceae bacterium]|nr:sigma-70 family RNA polymerase sigma factor [Gemmatimonadaceae bacterium]